jgi:phosphatidylserine/phosphatidylglycerophosphate/cardiolipin synthase-like enzyme
VGVRVPKPLVFAGGVLVVCALGAAAATDGNVLGTAFTAVSSAIRPIGPGPGARGLDDPGGRKTGGESAAGTKVGTSGGAVGGSTGGGVVGGGTAGGEEHGPGFGAGAAAPAVVRRVGPGLETGSIFNSPVGGAKKADLIAAQVGRLIAATPKGAAIDVAMYHFSSLDTATMLIAADRRKIGVHVVLDHESEPYAAAEKLRHALGSNPKKRSWVVMCAKGRGCVGPEFNHNKFFLFSQTLGSRNVIVQTSANSTDGARNTQWNDALTIQDAGVYAGYRRYFDDLAHQRHNADYHRVIRSGPYRLDFFPWKSGDPISQALDKVSCAGGTRIRLSLGHFTWGPIARRLWKLDDAGCRVQIVFDIVGPTAIEDLAKDGGHHGGPELEYLTESGSTYAHSKYLLIDGGYERRPQKVVLTGSNNYTTVGLHGHDEAMITVADPALEAQYVANFDAVFAHGHRISPADPGALPEDVLEPEIPADKTGGAE